MLESKPGFATGDLHPIPQIQVCSGQMPKWERGLLSEKDQRSQLIISC